ncbi:hypothetical protein FSP39_001683 [Pinctada imbricata]|uniref:PPM-type phosphatase domain-containing protein n=1 Tax=Pinctada imbricata TaxID=66713 RepID=A0AA89BWM9_PINIB|nr:hypothetical protein FSP39_001683 [Pinctada imbricata]
MFRICSVFRQACETSATRSQFLAVAAPVNNVPSRSKRSRRRTRGYDAGRALLTFRQSVERAPDPLAFPKLAPQQVTKILNLNESRKEVDTSHPCAVKRYDINKIPSNDPIEDRDVHGQLSISKHSSPYLFGVYDGHAGSACSQTLCDRLFQYIAVSLSPYEILEKITSQRIRVEDIVTMYENQYSTEHIPDHLASIYKKSVLKYAKEMLASYEHHLVSDHLISAFTRLDQDMLEEGLPSTEGFSIDSLESTLSGSCACIAMVDNTELYVANTGDCRAILGVQGLDEEWHHVELSHVHDLQNPQEVRRILQSHPNESTNIIKQGRLFGELAPSRAFGDARYKWTLSEMKCFKDYLSQPNAELGINPERVMPNNYITPPYLTAEPEVMKHTLTPNDKFLVIATDGLWDMLSPEQVVKLVAGHMLGQQVMIPEDLNYGNIGTLKEINKYLKQRKVGFSNRTVDDNAATHLLRNAFGPEHGRISAFLSLPESMSRLYRDDTTVIVVFFDSEFIKNTSKMV